MDYNKNYYQELGLNKDASDEDIKKAYRKLAHQHHPDKNQGNKNSETLFQKINEANSVLSDTKSKNDYDQRSPHGKSYSPFNGFGSNFEFHFGNGNDIFSQFFGADSPFGNPFGGAGFNPFRRDEFMENLDINMSVTINLKQIYLNDHLTIKYKRNVPCDNCNGTGFDNQSHSDTCDVCEGSGKDRFGNTCAYCKGDGKVYIGQCKTCGGEKVLLKDTEVTMQNISKIRNNVKSIQRGYGHQSKYYREKTGSLILNINVDRSDSYKIINNFELHQIIDVHFQDAIDGVEFLYKHVDDSSLKIKLPTKTKNDDIIRVKEKGLIVDGNMRNDLYLKVNIIIDYGKL